MLSSPGSNLSIPVSVCKVSWQEERAQLQLLSVESGANRKCLQNQSDILLILQNTVKYWFF